MLVIYNILLWMAAPFVLLYYGTKMMLTGKSRKGIRQQFGFIPKKIIVRSLLN